MFFAKPHLSGVRIIYLFQPFCSNVVQVTNHISSFFVKGGCRESERRKKVRTFAPVWILCKLL